MEFEQRRLETAQGNTIKACAKQEVQRKKACFTLNNWTLQDWEILRDNRDKFFRLVVGQEFAPTTGTPHLQGYCEFKKKERRIAFFRTLLGHERTSFNKKPIKGTIEQNYDYCKKEEIALIKHNIPRFTEKITMEDLKGSNRPEKHQEIWKKDSLVLERARKHR